MKALYLTSLECWNMGMMEFGTDWRVGLHPDRGTGVTVPSKSLFKKGRAWVSDPAAARSENVALPHADQINAPCEVGRANRLGEPLIRVVRAIRMLKKIPLSFILACREGHASACLGRADAHPSRECFLPVFQNSTIPLFLSKVLLLCSLCGSLYGAEPQPAPQAAEGAPSTWAGVDETVVEKYAEAAGRPGRAPLINTDQGDLLLFVFLLAGAIGGFVAGYSYRSLVQRSNTLLAALLLAGLACTAPSSAEEHHVEPQSPHQHIHDEPSDAPLSYEVI